MTMRSPIRLLLVLQVLYVACAVSTNEDVWEEDLIHTDGGSEEAETTKENVTSPPLSISGNDLKRLQEAEARLRQAAHRALKLAEV